jgi:hypothetical protein
MSEVSTFAKRGVIISQEFSTSHEKPEENHLHVHSKNAYKQPTRRWAAFFSEHFACGCIFSKDIPSMTQ